ncbi:MAG: hypothetical protein RI964_2630 [Pseudomonadota bacterium]|jgi:O-antigen/teichoic acid export membrane protein
MYLKHGLIYLLAKVVPAFASFISVAAYTRWLTAEEYGVYTTIVVFVSSLNGFLFGWLYVGIMRFWNAQEVSATAVQQLISFAVVVISGVVGIGATGYALLNGHTTVAVSFFILFTSTALYESYQRVNSITLQVNQYLLTEIARTLLTLVIGLILVWSGYHWIGAMGGVTLGIFFTLVFSGGIWRYLKVTWREVDLVVLKKILQYGLPLSLSFVLLDIIFTSDRLLIGLLAGYSKAGQYAVSYNVPHQIIMMLTSSLNLAAYPIVIRTLEKEGQSQAEEKLKQYFLILMGVCVPAIFGLIGIGKVFLPLLLGKEFVATAIQLLPWIGVAVLEHCLYLFYVSLTFQLAKCTTDAVKVVAVGAGVNLVLNFAMIPLFGLQGAISASILAYALCLVYGYYLGSANFKLIIPWGDLLKIVFASGTMLLVMGYTPNLNAILSIVLKILIGVLVYVAMVVALNVGDVRSQLNVLRSLMVARYRREVVS